MYEIPLEKKQCLRVPHFTDFTKTLYMENEQDRYLEVCFLIIYFSDIAVQKLPLGEELNCTCNDTVEIKNTIENLYLRAEITRRI